MPRPGWPGVGLLLAFASPALAAQEPAAPPVAQAVRASGPIRVDGVLDEPDWAAVPPIGRLLQREPREGEAPSEETEVRILYDEDNLYFGILCRDRQPSAVVATQLARDADLSVDDRVTVVLDPFFDQRNGFFFETNPAGARVDGQISNNGEQLSTAWDGIWEARARRTPEGWLAELAIPFKTLRFKPGQTTWGLNVERQIKRLNEVDRWASPRHDIWIGNLSAAGQLGGLSGLRQGLGLDLKPFLSAGEEQGSGRFKVGLDVFKALTPSLTASLTVNTDFAETEADARQVNLTRFPLFFPEKRAFFLEGAGVYDIAGLGSQSTDLVPFFSRTIGLLQGVEVPILAGAKLSGRVSGFNVGLLDVETGTSDELGVPRQNLLAFRASRNLFEQSWVGVIATRGNPAGTGDNTLLGADLRLATSRFRGGQNLSLDLWGMRTSDQASGRNDHAWGFKLDYPNDLWDANLSFKRIGDFFAPGLGFVPRTGIQKTGLAISFKPRPERFGIRQFFFEVVPEYVTNLEGRVESWSVFTAPLNLVTESGEHIEANWIPSFERLLLPFEIWPGVIVPPGSYHWSRFGAEVETAAKRSWVLALEGKWGDFYDGSLRQVEAALTLKPSTHVSLVAGFEYNHARLRGGSFVTRILSGRLNLGLSPDLTWSNLVQYDNESRTLGAQSRMHWTLRPGRDVFLVFNRGWLRREDGTYLPEFDRGSVKLQYTIRL
jgi:hypothetical protein